MLGLIAWGKNVARKIFWGVFFLKAETENKPGTGASFEELYDLHFDAVNRYLRYRINSSWDADDLTAAVFLKALELLRDEEVRQLREMLCLLPLEQRDVVSLRYAGELKFGQIALILAKSESAVRMIHHRALKALRTVLISNNEGGERVARG